MQKEKTEPFSIHTLSWWKRFVEHAEGNHALFWLIAVSFLEPIILPLIPESVLVPLILAHPKHAKKYTLIAAVSSMTGAIVGYGIGFYFFSQFGTSFLTHFHLRRWFHTVQTLLGVNIFFVMLIIGFTPIPDKAFVLLAGFFHVAYIQFVLGFFFGRLLRFGVVSYLTYHYGLHVLKLAWRYFQWIMVVLAVVVVFLCLHAFHILP